VPGNSALRAPLPIAPFGTVQQCAKNYGAVKIGQAKPIHRPVCGDEGRCAPIADDPVPLDSRIGNNGGVFGVV